MGFLEAKKQLGAEAITPGAVKVGLTSGTGMQITWADGHESRYLFAWLRDACPCATCEEERGKSGRKPGEKPAADPAALPMYKPAVRPSAVQPVGKYAIQFDWNDGHTAGIYSWRYLREVCPCESCQPPAASSR
jgi:DUF971 family protein